ncbi:sulfite exporter TauE/SafE family protein [Belnapia sp. F-4-1]|uniref:sulfite exporter TauE/SafE family protein n=1 Tax=Belnapia sp. F-4-1 TaxID=1545443 RepID=UPI00068D52C8|nr:sulfite exporter TauE/SafE family protein [Belnapia sp. F-4-1]
MDHALLVTALVGGVSLFYATVGQAGGTAFLAIMAFALFPAAEMRATALLLNILVAAYATWRLHQGATLEWHLLAKFTPPSLVTAFLGGLLVVEGRAYFALTGLLLVLAAGLMLLRRTADTVGNGDVRLAPAATAGAGVGFVSGLTGVGGGVFLTPLVIVLGSTSPRHAAALAPPFILCNSALALLGVLLAGQRPAEGTSFYALGALAGAVLGTAFGQRWMSQRATRIVLAAILLVAGVRLLLR